MPVLERICAGMTNNTDAVPRLEYCAKGHLLIGDNVRYFYTEKMEIDAQCRVCQRQANKLLKKGTR